MFISKLFFLVIFINNLYNSSCEISDKRLCVDDKCSVPISLAKTLIRYSSPEPHGLSFAPNQDVKIFSKEAGSVASLWGAEINGKRGYIPKHFVREYRILKKPTKLVDTKITKEPQVPNTSENDVKPDKPLEPYEIIDGTKLYISPLEEQADLQDNISSSKDLEKTSEEEISIDEHVSNKLNENEVNQNNSNNSSSTDNEVQINEPKDSLTLAFPTENEGYKKDYHKSSLTDNEIQNKPQESVTSAFTTYSLKLQENVLGDLQSTDHVLNKSLSGETASNEDKFLAVEKTSSEEESPTKEQSSTDEQSPEKEKPLSKEDSFTEGKEFTSEEKLTVEEVTLPKEKTSAEEKSLPEENSLAAEKIPTIENSSTGEKSENVELKLSSEPTESKEELAITGISETENNSSLPSEMSVVSDNSITEEFKSTENSNPEIENLKLSSGENYLGEQKSNHVQDNVIGTNENVGDTSKEDIGSSLVDSSPSISSPIDEAKDNFPKNPEEMNDLVNKISNQLNENTITNTEALNNVENSKEIENNPPPTLLPIFPPFPGSLANLVTPPPNIDENQAQLSQNNEIDQNLVAKDLNNNISPFLDNDNKENESDDAIDRNQDGILLKPDLSQPFVEKTVIQDSESAPTNQGYLSPKIDDFDSENSDKINQNSDEEYQNSPESVIAQKEPKVDQILAPEQGLFTDDTATENNIDASNEHSDQPHFETNEESAGVFSTFMSFFDWSSPADANNDNSAIDKIDENNLKCDANIDQFFFSLNSNLMMHLITTVVVFITFLLFYLSVNKHRIESPLVAKINQLEKDLLIMIKEKESFSEKNMPETPNDLINSEELIQLNQKLGQVSNEKEDLEVQLNTLKEELEKKDNQIENLEKELETSTEVGLELNRLISEVLDPSTNGNEKLKENVEQFQKQLQEQTEVIKSMSARLKAKEVENVELLLEIEETNKNAASVQQRIQEMVEKVTSIEKEKDAQQEALQNEIKIYQSKYNELVAKSEEFNNEIQILKTKLANSEREIDLKIKECNSLKESFKNISSMKNDNQTLNSVLDTISMKAEYDQTKSDLEKYVRELQQNQSEKAIIENKYQAIAQEINELKNRYQEVDKEKLETDMKLEVLNNYFKKREMELQEEVLKYKSIWDAKEGEATSTTERIKLLQEEIENYKAQNEALKQEILSQEIALKSQITVLEKKAHENWVSARQSERKLEDARQEAAQLRNRLTFRQRNINEEMVQNGLDQNDTTMSSQPSMYSPASPPLFYDNGRDQVTKSPIPGLPPFLPPPPGAPFVPPPVPNLSGMPLPPPFMPPLPAGFPGDHRPPPLGRMSSPPIKSRYSPDTSAFSPYERGSPSPIYDSEYGSGPYRNYSPYNSEDDRRGYRSPSPVTRTKMRPSKSSLTTPKVNRSNESLEKTNSKKSNMV